jgi:hypothetical protein
VITWNAPLSTRSETHRRWGNPPVNFRQTTVKGYGSRGAKAVIYAVTVAAVGIDLTQPLKRYDRPTA